MSYGPRNIYTVCAHVRIGDLTVCEEQKVSDVERQLQPGGCWANLSLTLRSCQPGTPTRLKYWFCEDCRAYFKDHDTTTRDGVLKYWAFKTSHRYSFSIPPMLVPPDLVFGSATPVAEDPRLCRYELISLAKEVPRELFETAVEWLQRLETIRTLTLELAETRSQSLTRPQAQSRETASGVVTTQPRITRPMSVPPFSDALSDDSQDPTESSLPSPQISRESPQVHAETLQKLCEEMVEDEPQRQGAASPSQVSPNIHDQVDQGPGDEAFGVVGAAPPSRPLTRCLTTPRAPKQVRFSLEINTVPSKPDAEDSTDPSINSRFSVSSKDSGEELASPAAVSPLSDHFVFADPETAAKLGSPAAARQVWAPQ
ncbi:hypothetical protein C8A05DRAFT_12469 [Staphylotrichum tortipilum]|uniref:Uncharacterized protein n=1 Tax=Staphylotrichum tortipilum TaxID=2831512 RepID=A0AAN6MRJ9_9PEZI|nr:hypothetical protein C8A05DRAFT_12469 [Staphylotrichum longicolle]